MVVSGGGEDGGGLSIAKILPLLRITVRASIGSQAYLFLRYIEVTRSIDKVVQTPGCVWLS